MRAYSVFQILALLTALLLRKPLPLPRPQRWAILIAALFGAGAGSKLPFVLLSHEPFFSGPAWFSDGKTILSGLAGGYLCVELVKLAMGIRAKTGDGFALPLAAAVAVGRWGCVFNGCCGAPYVPMIESAFHATMAVTLWRLQKVEALRWQLLKLYLIAYCAFRFGIEFGRTEPRVAWGLTAYQFGAAAMAAVLAFLWRVDERLKSLPPAPAADTLAP
ncbi:MAG: prolipoprotein diacylglyceryl transferase [Planctomycetes bacterium]|nr:prolipoprotein diacylglyceryl transferase [Planctomycetota bacterium]